MFLEKPLARRALGGQFMSIVSESSHGDGTGLVVRLRVGALCCEVRGASEASAHVPGERPWTGYGIAPG